eukprot:gene10899-14607_t
MNGPEAAMKMREELHYTGQIIGTQQNSCERRKSSQTSMVLPSGVTGNVLPEEISRFISHGANEVLTK